MLKGEQPSTRTPGIAANAPVFGCGTVRVHSLQTPATRSFALLGIRNEISRN
jgi:hypothetical protein